MSEDARPPVPIEESGQVGPPQYAGAAEPWMGPEPEEEGDNSQALKRILASLQRYRWLLLLSVVVGAGAGMLAYRLGVPRYQTEGQFWIVQSSNTGIPGPIQQSELLNGAAYQDLMRTNAVLNPVVIKERLYVQTAPENADALADFEVNRGERPDQFVYRVGSYKLEVAEGGGSWTLFTDDGVELERGAVGDSVGVELGFRWQPPASELTPGRVIEFRVVTPQDAARQLRERINASITRDGNFMTLSLEGEDPERITGVLQSVMDRLLEVALSLKRAQLDTQIVNTRNQLTSAEAKLDSARNTFESFKVNTVTLPTEESAPVAAGLAQTTNTVFNDFFSKRQELDDLRRDREQLQGLLESIPSEGVRVERFEIIPAVANSTEMKQALSDLVSKRSERRELLQRYTPEYPAVQDLDSRIEQIEQRDIPSLTRQLIGRLQSQEADLRATLDSREDELRRIPPRSIREATLQQEVASANALYQEVLSRLNTSQLAKANTANDLQVIDFPSVPTVPSRDDRVRWFALAFLGCVALGALAAVGLDTFDPRLRYPTEVSRAMGLEILGAVPKVKAAKRGNAEVVLEAFREIRMRVQYAYGNTRPLILSVTSPESGEGKTFVSANLGITFAQLGRKTLIIDADTRRGDMHDLFEANRKPGLTDLFQRKVDGSAIQKTKHDNLHFLPCGSRFTESPELLSSRDMQELLAAAKRRYEVILIDSPPMTAGSDAFIIGALTGNVLIVLRSGSTHKELARAKMEAFYRLPVRLLGAVLNDIEPGSAYGAYRYYSYYLPGYRPGEEPEETRVVTM